MKKSYDFSKGVRGAVVPSTGKTRVTMYLDDEVLEAFRAKAVVEGKGYQTMINEVLRNEIAVKNSSQVTVEVLRQIIRDELQGVGAH